MRYYRYLIMSVSSALIASGSAPLLNAQAVKRAVPADPPPKAPARQQLERAAEEFPSEKIVPDRQPRPAGDQAALGVIISDSPSLGVLITEVHRDSPAWNAGLRAGDYLMRLDRQSIKTPQDYLAIMDEQSPDDTVMLVIWRAGRTFRGMSELADTAHVRDTIVHNGLSLLEDDRPVTDDRLTPVELETREPVTIHDGSSTTVIESDDDFNLRSYPQLIEEHRKLKRRLEALNRQLKRLDAEHNQK